MSYSIYFKQVGQTPSEEQWAEIEVAAKQIVAKYKDILCFEYDEPRQSPQVNESLIRFNGKEDDGHETFLLQRNMQGFDFCKTARKPYTDAVKEILEEVNKIAPQWLSISDDGGWRLF